MKVAFEDGFQKKILKLRQKNDLLYRKIIKTIETFQVNQQYSALKLHKLKGNMDIYWSISVERNFRLIFYYAPEGALFVDMGTHDQVYKK